MALTPCTNLCSKTLVCKNRSISVTALLAFPIPAIAAQVFFQGQFTRLLLLVCSSALIIWCNSGYNLITVEDTGGF